ncbi:glycosyltransferase [Rhizobium phage RL2RES]|uniref:Glycosyltransferase n=1 Tax=Rhizobium phage RL2RES TaxID=103371 RepID=A0A6B9J1Q7_9CAUD|nr:glycosyltransferase [Rhizobium phage RL2RES]QGZ14130.1 hypothetical protein RL2RES_155 [Rhizobium phage RL2RES]
MKIAIITSHFTATLADHTRITNGLDAIVVKAIPILQKQGHEIHVICAGAVDEYWKDKITPHMLVPITLERLEGNKQAKMNLTRGYYKCVKSCLLRIDPDLVWSHIPSPGTSADIAKDFPTIHHVHEVNQNAMYAIGRLKGLSAVIKNGGTVYNSYFAEKVQREIAADFITRTKQEDARYLLDEPITSVYQFVNAPLDEKFLTAEILPSDGLPLMVGRYDSKFTGKNIHLIDKLGILLTAVVSGNHPKIFDQLRESGTTETHFNLTRGQTIDVMRHAGCHIMAYLHETVGIFNYEMMCLGSMPVTIGLSEDEPNAAWTFANKIFENTNKYLPDSIPIDDPNLAERIRYDVNKLAFDTLEERQDIAHHARTALSHDAWYKEFMSLVPNTSKKQTLDIF